MSRLKDLRQEAGMTQKALAEKAGVNIRLVQKYEDGEADIENMTLINAVRIAWALGIQAEDLI